MDNTYKTESANPVKYGKEPSQYWQLRSTEKLAVTTGTWKSILMQLYYKLLLDIAGKNKLDKWWVHFELWFAILGSHLCSFNGHLILYVDVLEPMFFWDSRKSLSTFPSVWKHSEKEHEKMLCWLTQKYLHPKIKYS